MQRLETRTKVKKKKVGGHGSKWCNCGHLVMHHRYDGCNAIEEGDNCEDHWVCGCMCIECIHKNELALKTLAKELDVDSC